MRYINSKRSLNQIQICTSRAYFSQLEIFLSVHSGFKWWWARSSPSQLPRVSCRKTISRVSCNFFLVKAIMRIPQHKFLSIPFLADTETRICKHGLDSFYTIVGSLAMFGLDRGRFSKLDFIHYLEITKPSNIRISNPTWNLCVVEIGNLWYQFKITLKLRGKCHIYVSISTFLAFVTCEESYRDER